MRAVTLLSSSSSWRCSRCILLAHEKTFPNNRLDYDRPNSGAVYNPGRVTADHIKYDISEGSGIWTSPLLHPEIDFSSVKIRFLDWSGDVHMKD